jgi:hypothetical protein
MKEATVTRSTKVVDFLCPTTCKSINNPLLEHHTLARVHWLKQQWSMFLDAIIGCANPWTYCLEVCPGQIYSNINTTHKDVLTRVSTKFGTTLNISTAPQWQGFQWIMSTLWFVKEKRHISECLYVCVSVIWQIISLMLLRSPYTNVNKYAERFCMGL